MDQESLVEQVQYQARLYGVDPALACAVVEQESSWNCWAIRFEPAFETRYIKPALPNAPTTEEMTRAMSFGLFQVMGENAREMGFQHQFLSMLCDPDIGISVGVRFLKKCLDAAEGDTTKALLRWNGGGNTAYPTQVIARMAKYQTPAQGASA
ncbi:MAG TPA: transglycosylase SLT domain-containing protein [Candidatus Angelobacter sp.]|nr:transglycosylase SLT domain-containing protein [Candidatus Angelobacter sp.]